MKHFDAALFSVLQLSLRGGATNGDSVNRGGFARVRALFADEASRT